MNIYHRHHIIPKHMGGSNDPSNIVLLTVEEHAEAHRILFEQHNKQEDYIAWKALSGQISISEASKQAWILGGIKGGKSNAKNKTGFCGRSKEKMSEDGRKNALMQIQNGTSAFLNPDKQRKFALKAAKIKAEKRANGHYEELDKHLSIHMTGRYTKEKGYKNAGWVDSAKGIEMSTKNNSITTCPHCNKNGQYRAMKRWHFENCKSK
jgi:hypothetical protein